MKRLRNPLKRFAIRLNMAASPPGDQAGLAPAPSQRYGSPAGGVARRTVRLATNSRCVNGFAAYRAFIEAAPPSPPRMAS
jgi:hypothetical protein